MVDEERLEIRPENGAAPDIDLANAGGWTQGTGPDLNDHHIYNVLSDADQGSLSEYGTAVMTNPTPSWRDSPATPEGTRNMAQPGDSALSLLAPAYVASVLVPSPDPSRYSDITVNLTLPGHPLGRGFVMNFAEKLPDGSQVLRSYGEGNGLAQSSSMPWGGYTDQNLNQPTWRAWQAEVHRDVAYYGGR